MHYNILFNGCSFTSGHELEGINKDYEYRNKHRFSQVVSNKTGLSYDNISCSGYSNDRIVRTTIDWFNKNTCDIAIIQFTQLHRIEYISNYEKYPVNFSIHRYGNALHHVITLWQTDNKKDYEETKEAHHNYYKYVYNNNISFYNFYKNLYILEQYFEKNNIKNYFIKLTPNFDWTTALDKFKMLLCDDEGNLLDFYWQSACKNRFTNIISIMENILDRGPDNYAKNYVDEGYPDLRGSHPSELGHQKIADYIINHALQDFKK